jgi:hypothetical protein
LIKEKDDEIKTVKHEREGIREKFKSNIDLQNSFQDEIKLRDDIEDA